MKVIVFRKFIDHSEFFNSKEDLLKSINSENVEISYHSWNQWSEKHTHIVKDKQTTYGFIESNSPDSLFVNAAIINCMASPRGQ